MKYSIVVPYYDRAGQFVHFLKSLRYWNFSMMEYEVIVVVDSKTSVGDRERLEWILKDHCDDIRIGLFTYDNTGSLNPCRLFNYGVTKARGEYIVITNPETAFLTPIFKQLDEGFAANPDSYQMISCLDGTMYKNPKVYLAQAWLQHSVYNNRMLHFCSSIKKSIFQQIGQFDEAYAKFPGVDDDDFIETIIANQIPVVLRDDIVVLHQPHEITFQVDLEACKPNKEYFVRKWGYNKWAVPSQVPGSSRWGLK